MGSSDSGHGRRGDDVNWNSGKGSLKTRYLVPSGKHTFEIDVFHDKNEGLVIAEIELSSDDEYFERPGWLGDEVTGMPQYYNANLIK